MYCSDNTLSNYYSVTLDKSDSCFFFGFGAGRRYPRLPLKREDHRHSKFDEKDRFKMQAMTTIYIKIT